MCGSRIRFFAWRLIARLGIKALYDQGHERWDHSAFLLYLEKLNAPARLGNKADTPPD